MKRTVFISHASADKAIADRVCEYLEKHGLACWIAPRNVTPGKNYGAAIVDAIDECRVCVLILSSQSNKSRQVVREIERAASSDSIILPFRIEDIQPSRDIAFYVSAAHWLDATQHPVDEQFDELLTAIQGWQETESNVEQAASLAPPSPLPGAIAPTQAPTPTPATAKRFPVWLVIAIAAGGLVAAGTFFFFGSAHSTKPVVSPTAAAESPSPAKPVVAVTPEATASVPEPSPTEASPTPTETPMPTPMPTVPPNRLKPGGRLRPGATPESIPEPITPPSTASPPSRFLAAVPPMNVPATPARPKPPVVREMAASSQLGNEFRANYAFDGNPNTAWVPKGRAIEQSLFAHFKSPTMVRSVSILSTKIHTLRIILSDGSNQLFTLEDQPKMQRFDLTIPVNADSAKFEIVSVFPGKERKAGISEIKFNEPAE